MSNVTITHYLLLITYKINVAETITKPIIEKEILESLQTKVEEEKQVIVHCCFPASPFLGNLIRICKSMHSSYNN